MREQENKQKAKAISKLVRVIERIEEWKKPKKCLCCGDVFFSQSPAAKWCPRCKSLSRGNHKARASFYGSVYEHGITLRKVIVRDKGICQICGKPVDLNDKGWNGYIGAFYPTIDHIIALANGGGHTWNNVQLAHAICNSLKGART